jgi:signal transduction histidine kinase
LASYSIATKSIKEKDEQKALISITHARKSLNTLQVLIEDILDLTKIKNLDEESSPIDFTAELKKILDNLSNMEGIDDIVISQDLQFQKTLSAKENRLTLIMQNLISNAIKYKDLGKENCFVKISTYEQDGLFVLDVEDNGIGIPEDKQADLFLMFKRFHPQAGYGSGLGLYMIKKSAHILGGKYRIYRYRQRFTFYAEHTFIIRRYIIWLFT